MLCFKRSVVGGGWGVRRPNTGIAVPESFWPLRGKLLPE
jgi:hypothetical protein